MQSKETILRKYCAVCSDLLTEENDSWEHVIPNALGGKRRIRGFICNTCNRRTGNEWDAALAAALQHFSVLIGVHRDRGSVQSAKFDKATHAPTEEDLQDGKIPEVFRDGNLEKIEMAPDGKMTTAEVTFSDVKTNSTRRIRITCRSIAELNKQLKKLGKKIPQINDDSTAITVSERAIEGPHWIGWDCEIGGPAQGRAITKIALALAVQAGARATDCEQAKEYFKEDGKACFNFFYDFDPIKDRTDGVPLHVVHVQGNSTSGQLIGYAELFGCLRFGVCLSTAYEGKPIDCTYAIDPTTGKEVKVKVDFHCNPKQITTMCDGGEFPKDDFEQALGKIMLTIQSLMGDRRLKRTSI